MPHLFQHAINYYVVFLPFDASSSGYSLQHDIATVYSKEEDFSDEFQKLEMTVPKAAYFARKDHPLTKIPGVDSRRLNEFPWVGNIVSPTWAKWALQATDVSEEQMQNMFLARVNDYDKTIDLVQNTDAIGGHVYNELIPHVEAGKISILDINWIIPHPKNTGIILSLNKRTHSLICKKIIEELQKFSKKWAVLQDFVAQ